MADVICVWVQMHLLPYSLCPCRAASLKAGGDGKGWKGAINFGPSGKQHPVDSAIITSSFSPCAFATDQALLPTSKCNYCQWGTVQFQALAPCQSYVKLLYRNPSFVSQGQKWCQDAWTITFASSILIQQRHLSKLILECSLLSEVIWWPKRVENPMPWIVKCTFRYF